ncbi:MAG TPA: TadE/TadG family type IV pilus assembly protein [Pantanalinema sp.]
MRLRGRALRDESGQSLVEFAIVLPILLVLTFGTIQLGIFLQRQITLTGASFLAARAATVGGRDGVAFDAPAKEVLSAYGEESEQPWIKAIAEGSDGQVTIKTEETERLIRLTAVKDNKEWNEGLAAFSRMLGAGTPPKVGQMGGTIAINREYVRGKGARSAAQADSNQMVEYQADLGPINGISNATRPVTDAIRGAFDKVGLGDQAVGMVGVFTFSPLQAVGPNPGGDIYMPGRSKAAVYASSDNETLPTAFTKQSTQLVESLRNAPLALGSLQKATIAIQDPLMKAGLEGFLYGVRRIADAADRTIVGLDVIDSQVFGVTKRGE